MNEINSYFLFNLFRTRMFILIGESSVQDANLQAFLAVARESSFSQAAEQLHLTQSAVSKRIALLEQQLDSALFDRIGRRVILTEAGKALQPRAERILQGYRDAQQAVSDLSGTVSGQLSIAISHHLGLHRLPAVLQLFGRSYPEVRLAVEFMDSEQAYARVLRGDVELAVVTLAERQPARIQQQSIWPDPLHFVCAVDHPLAQRDTLQLATLAEQPLILPGAATNTSALVREVFSAEQLPLQSAISTNYLETIKTMVAIGMGWSLLPQTLCSDLYILQVACPPIVRQLGYLHLANRTLSNAAEQFIALLHAQRAPVVLQSV